MKKYMVLTILAVSAFMFAPEVSAHGFGERYDLPIPLSYFLIGAALTVIFSFFVIGWFIRSNTTGKEYPTLNIYQFSIGVWFCKVAGKL
ncbi:MAG: hypothetical protein VYE36_03395, partial [Chloroflexota bacterium]|nr:hypothetical protein [Chloroflexota bacterium]